MTDICKQVATFIAASTNLVLGGDIFYYQLPDEIDTGVVVQRNKSAVHVPVQIDAGVHSLRVAVRAKTADSAYSLADTIYGILSADVDEAIGDMPGYIILSECTAQVKLYDKPMWDSTDQHGRKIFYFTALLITKR